MVHSGEAWIKEHAGAHPASDPIPAALVGRWQQTGTRFVFEFTDEGTYANYYAISDAGYAISGDGSTLTWSGYNYARKFDTSTSLPGVWERYWPDDAVYEAFTFREDGTYTAYWRPWNEEYFGTYLENVPSPGMLRLRELNAVVTLAGAQITFDPPYMPTRSATFTLEESRLTLTYQDGPTVTYGRVG